MTSGDVGNLQDFEKLISGAAEISLGLIGPDEMPQLVATVDVIDAAHYQLPAAAGGENEPPDDALLVAGDAEENVANVRIVTLNSPLKDEISTFARLLKDY